MVCMNQPDLLIDAFIVVATPFGAMALGARGQRLRGVILPRLDSNKPVEAAVEEIWPDAKMNRRTVPHVVEHVRQYWAGKRTEAFQVDLDLEGFSCFYGKVWLQTMQIPPGQVQTYGELAKEVGSPKAYRAVGGAMAANPFPLLVPCHRIVAASAIGGFSSPGGVPLKQKLLDFECKKYRQRQSL